ncbi:hypothetical protein DFH09DRAFT_1136639, partial [Mycena vulgaris]
MALPSAVKRSLLRKVHIRREGGAHFAAHPAASASASSNATPPGLKTIAITISTATTSRGSSLAHLRCLGQGVTAARASGRARSGPGSGMAGVWWRRCMRGQAEMGRGYELRSSGVWELGEGEISTAEGRAEALRGDTRPASKAPWSSTPCALRHAPDALDRLPPPPQEPALHYPLV